MTDSPEPVSPTTLANRDVVSFFKHYFEDEDGCPDRSRIPETLVLPGLEDIEEVRMAAKNIVGLQTFTVGLNADSRVLILGWSRGKVVDEANKIFRQQFDRVTKQQQKGRDRTMIDLTQDSAVTQEAVQTPRSSIQNPPNQTTQRTAPTTITTQNATNTQEPWGGSLVANGEFFADPDNPLVRRYIDAWTEASMLRASQGTTAIQARFQSHRN